MTVTPSFETSGALLAGTAQSRLRDIHTVLRLDADTPNEELADLVAAAEGMCYVLDAIQQPHVVQREVIANGEKLSGRA
jgi:hypothetical protein